MAVLPLITYPHPVLKALCTPVTDFGPDLATLADDLYDTMKAAPGVGITAAHVGVAVRLVVLDLPEIGGRRTYVNPQILSSSDELMNHTEGSVSMPGATETVTRPRAVKLRYQDLDGTAHEEELDGFPAICMQHEIDQLDGIFWLQRLSKLKRDRLTKKWEKMRG
ncbi:peptide deformylase [Ciceribacter lividus]|uniref:Peptide deformylase-like n=1 Tax=Ciceribacter lividus TaxID=1197950 RepID=A0A6I7HSE3_9HYPH|nr:peptide deformylase [Ciceribacter lividus]RCW28686.1 peptide deformylase [Ciceribacter lividus]